MTMTTKEKILYEALTLFSEKGYKGTSVKDIADAVGIKDSSLYKHYKSKQEILDMIMASIEEHIGEMSAGFGIPAAEDFQQAVSFYEGFDEEGIVELSKKLFMFYLKDDMVSKFWRMGTMEQYQNPQVAQSFRRFFFEASIEYQTALFAEMVRQGAFIDADPAVMAMDFYTPIFFLLSKYSGQQGKDEEALEILAKQVKAFYHTYKR